MTDAAPSAVSCVFSPTDLVDVDSVVDLVRTWLSEAERHPASGSARQLGGVLRDPKGLGFAVGFIDGVVRPEDLGVAARALRTVAPDAPSFLSAPMRALIRLGGLAAPLLPGIVVPAARRVLRGMVGHLVVDAREQRLGRAIAAIRTDGIRLNVNLLGEAVLGAREADRRLEGTRRLLARDDVDYVSIKVSSTVRPHSPWAFEEAVDDIVERLRPLFRLAAAASPAKFINLDMEEYKDLDLTIAVFTRLLDEPELAGLEAGIVLQAYLPDALGAMQRLQEWAASRRARGGAGIKVRLVKGANLPMERVDASIHGWPLATWDRKEDSDTNYKRVLYWALTPERVANVRIGVAGHNLFDVAHAWLLAGARGVREAIEFEMLLGMAQGQAEAVRRTVGGLLLYTPVVHPDEFDVAIAYLIRRLEEGASSENFMSAVFELSASEELFARERERFAASLRALAAPGAMDAPTANRVPGRYVAVRHPVPGVFENTPDTDPAVAANRRWVREVLGRVPDSTLGAEVARASFVDDPTALDGILHTTRTAGEAWGARTGAERGTILHALGDALEAHRTELVEVMASETGKTIDQADPEVSEAIDFAHFYGELATELDRVDGARHVPDALTLVTPPWNFPVAIPAGSTLAALAAGSAVVLKPAGPAERCGAVLATVLKRGLRSAGVADDLIALVQVAESGLGATLVAHPSVDRVVLTGAYETAELFRSFRPDLPLLAETSGKNAIIVTPSVDLDLAVRDVVASAFGHAGQKCSAASLVVLVGSVATSRRFRSQLLDAVSSLAVGYPADATTQVGPTIEPAAGKLLAGLTELGEGEEWLIAPRRLDDEGRLWSPGVRGGVRRGSEYHRTEYFGPVLGIMTAATLEEAIDIVNEVDYGLTSGLHSLDREELRAWLARIQAGNLYVNRGITGAIVRRQPFGGWKRSAVGAGAKAGGENYLVGFGSWRKAPASGSAVGGGVRPEPSGDVRRLVETASAVLDDAEGVALRRAVRSDAVAWRDRFATPTDVSGLSAERNVMRYLPFPDPVAVRLASGGATADLVRVVAAAVTAGARVEVSLDPAIVLGARLELAVGAAPSVNRVRIETDDVFGRRLRTSVAGRVRLIGGSVRGVCEATDGRPDLAIYAAPVTEAGRIELLPFLREQAVSITAHRFGTPNRLSDGIL